jgi:hypothetical protein
MVSQLFNIRLNLSNMKKSTYQHYFQNSHDNLYFLMKTCDMYFFCSAHPNYKQDLVIIGLLISSFFDDTAERSNESND